MCPWRSGRELGDDLSQTGKAGVYRYALLGPLARGPGVLEALTSSQIDKMAGASRDFDLRRTRFTLKTACDREDLALMAVESVCRIADPKFKACSKSSTELMST